MKEPLSFIQDITDFIFIEDKLETSDIIFIPGGSYPDHAENAALLWKNEMAPLIMPSGKYSIKKGYFPGPQFKADIYSDIYSTEWDFIKDVLMKNGVSESAILWEGNATNTYENAIFSQGQTVSLGLDINKAIISCKADHARRCLMYYQALFPETKFFISPVPSRGVTRDNWYLSARGIEKVLGELERCGSQFAEIMKKLNLEEYE